MRRCRIHVTGAPGSGTTTLGHALAMRLAAPHFDTDDFFWLPTDPPYLQERATSDRLRLMREMFVGGKDWILSGSLGRWGDEFRLTIDFVVFLSVPDALRIDRLRNREAIKFGAAAIAPGGPQHRNFADFIEWASHYEDGTREGRSRPRHEAWLATLKCPILRLDSGAPVEALVERVAAALRGPTP